MTHLSKQQLVRQIKKWGFKKNARSEEWKQITSVLGNRSRIGKQSEILLHGNQVDPKKLKKAISRYDFPSLREKFLTGPQTSRGSRTNTEPVSGSGPESCIHVLSPVQQVPEIHLMINLPSYQSHDLLKKTCKERKIPFGCVLIISDSRFFSNSISNTSSSLENDEESGTLLTRENRSIFMDINNEPDLIDSLPRPGEISPIAKSHHEGGSTSSFARAWEILPTRQLLENEDAYFLEKHDGEPSMNLNDMIRSDPMAASLFYVKHMIYLISNNMSNGKCFVDWIIAQQIEQEFSKLIKTKTPTFAAMAPNMLYWAVCKGSLDLLKAALKHGISLNEPIKSFDYPFNYQTPLVLSIIRKQQHVAEFLVLAGADVNCRAELDFDTDSDSDDEFENSSIPSHGGTPPPIWYAADFCMFELIPFLVEHDADPNLGAGQSSFQSTLTKAINRGADISIVQTLLDAGADPNGIDLSYGEASCLPLRAAVKRNEFDLFSLLLQKGAKINAPFEWGFEGLFHHVSKMDRWAKGCLSSILATAIEVKNRRTDTFLGEREYDNRILDALLEAGADITPKTPIPFVLDFHHNWTPLQMAASHGDIEMVKCLLSSGVPVQNDPKHGMSALACAAGGGYVDIMRLLIENGADVNLPAIVKGSRTALQAAVGNGSLAAIDIILGAGADPNAAAADEIGERAVFLAVSHKNPAALSRLVKAGATISEGFESFSLLGVAVEKKNWGLIHYLLEFGININHLSGKYKYHPLKMAIRNGDQQLVRLLIERGAEMHCSMISLAVQREDTEMVQLLHSEGVPLESEDGQDMALEDAIVPALPEMTKMLLRLGADANKPLSARCTGYREFSKKVYLNTMAPLKFAIHNMEYIDEDSDITSVCKALIAAGARVNETDGLGNKCSCVGEEPSSERSTCEVCEETCLCAALIYDLGDLARLLLQNGADVHLRSPCGTTPLQAAAAKGNLQMLQELLDRGANINVSAAGTRGRTPLQAAAQKGSLACVRVLIERGANVNALPATNRGVTALQASAINGFLVITKMLLEAGADVGATAAEINGRTAIDGAAEMGRLDTLQLLLDNYHGDVPLSVLCDSATVFARRQRHTAVVQFLQEYKSGHGFTGQNAGEQFEI
jgi:ankyrin repeat protein